MAATGIKCLMTIQDDRYAIGEFHIQNSNDFDAVKPRFISLFKQRMLLSGPPAIAFRGRMSLIGARRVTRTLSKIDLALAGIASSQTFTNKDGKSADNTSDQPKSSVQLLLTTEDGTTHSTYLGAIPDVIVGELPEGPEVGLFPGYAVVVKAYTDLLVSDAWGTTVRAKDDATVQAKGISDVVVDDATGLVQVTAPTFDPQVVRNQKVMIRGFLPENKAFKRLTGIYRISLVSDAGGGQSNYLLLGTAGLNVNHPLSKGTIEKVDYVFKKYIAGSIGLQTTRKRGNRQLAGPGKLIRPARV
jgi:hypothetical protein